MSGANIASGTIPASALSGGTYVDLATAQTIGGAKTFSAISTFNADSSFNGNISTIGTSSQVASLTNTNYAAISNTSFARIGINTAGTKIYGLIPGTGVYTITYNSSNNTWSTVTQLFAFPASYAMAIASSESRGIVFGQLSNAYYFNTNGTYTLFDSANRSYFGCDITANGNTIVACTSTNNDYIYYSTWNGSTFNTLSSITSTLSPAGVTNAGGVSITPDGQIIAYALSNKTIYYATWNGTTYNNNSTISGIPSQYTLVSVKFASNYTLFCSVIDSNNMIIIYYSIYNTALKTYTSFALLYQTNTSNPSYLVGLAVDNTANFLYLYSVYKLSYSISYSPSYSQLNSNWVTVGANSVGQYGNYALYVNGTSYITNGIVATSKQTIDFSNNAPIMSGANIASGTIPASALNGGGSYVDLSTTQTVGGAKTFSSLMTLSNGLTVSSGTVTLPSRSIADSALSTNVPLINGTNTFSGTVAFSTTTPTAPTALTTDNSTTLATTAYVKSNLSSYLTTSTASSTYATQSSLSSYLTTSSASSTYATQSSLSSYLTTSTASSTYATQSSLSSYLTTSSASSTYATQSSLSSYLTTSSASSTYATQSSLSSYLTTSAASSTYAPLANPALTGTPTAPTRITSDNSTAIATTAYVNNAISGLSYVDLTTAQTIGGNKTFSNQITAPSYNATSDRRLKGNIEPLDNQWSNILSITPVSFDWKESKRGDIGFIAQDIHKQYPHLKPDYSEVQDPKSTAEEPVDLSGNPLYYTIDYGRMTPFLWKGLQETMQEIDSLKKENAQLKELIHGLSERIASLEYR
jgi:hypothetical protein